MHFAIDYLFAIPLFFFPIQTLQFFGLTTPDVFTARVVASALFAIGGISLIYRDSDKKVLSGFLTLKIIWSITVILGLLLSISQSGIFNLKIGFVVLVFLLFSLAWSYFKRKLES